MSDDDIFKDLEEQFSDIEINDVINVKKIKTGELVNMIHDLNSQLFEMGEAISPKTQAARDAHSLRNACQVELNKRITSSDCDY